LCLAPLHQGLMHLSFQLGADGAEETAEVLEAFLEALVVSNVSYYRRYPNGPCCAGCAHVRYRPPRRVEHGFSSQHFDSIEVMAVKGVAACGSVAAMRAARLRYEGRDAKVVLERVGDRNQFHAVVLVDGERIDPTANLQRVGDCGCGSKP
jgi:hypothetical protein